MSTPRTFSGKMDRDDFFAWLNPVLPIAEIYDHARLLSDFVEVDEDAYDYFLGMMPPVFSTASGFSISEATTGDIRLSFFKSGSGFPVEILIDEAIAKAEGGAA